MSLFELVEQPEVDAPVLVLALEGWIDAGGAAARAAMSLVEGVQLTVVARFDTDELLDHRSRRPVVHIEAGLNRGLTWPSIDLLHLEDPGGSDVLLLTGAEPDHRWRSFSHDVVELAHRARTRLVVGLGAYPAAVPHTRPSLTACTATERSLVEAVAEVQASIDVPAGVHAAIEERCAASGLPAVGVWAQVPHYAAAMPYPGAALTLVEKLNDLCGFRFATGTLTEEAATVRARLDELVAASSEHVALLHQLETRADEQGERGEGSGRLDVPSGEELASEIERFLREQGGR